MLWDLKADGASRHPRHCEWNTAPAPAYVVEITTYTDSSVFDALAGEWNALLSRSATKTLFLTLEWQKTWWQSLGEGDLRVIAMRDEAGALIGLAPLFFGANALAGAEVALVGCREVSDYLDFIFDRAHETACYQALIDVLAAPDCPPWNFIGLCNIPETSPTFTRLPDLAQARGWRTEMKFEDVCPIRNSPARSRLTWRRWTARSAVNSRANCAAPAKMRSWSSRTAPRRSMATCTTLFN